MTKRWLLLLGLGALLLASAVMLGLTPEAAEMPNADAAPLAAQQAALAAAEPVRTPLAASTDFAHRFAAALQGQEPPLAAAGPDDPRAAVLQGRVAVRQKPWQALADIEVMLTPSWLDTVLPIELGDADEPLPPLRGPAVRTDAQGRFTLRFVPPPHQLFFRIGRDSMWSDFQQVARLPHAGESIDLGNVLVDDRGSISGRAIDLDGRPLADVEVRGVDDPLLDADLDSRELRAERTRGLEYFRPTGFVDGQPLPRWVAQRDRLLPFPQTRTDADGNFVLTGLRQGVHDLFLHAKDASGRRSGVSVMGGICTVLGDVPLQVGAAQPVQLLHADHKTPWIGARVTAMPADFAFTGPAVGTDFEGKALLRDLDADSRCTLLFQYPQGGGYVRLGDFAVDAATLVFAVPGPEAVNLLVTDVAGAPVADASVALLQREGALRPRDLLLPRWFQPRQEGPGRFRAHRAAGKVLALATAAGFAPAVAVLAGDTTSIVMQRGLEVRLRCVDCNGAAVAGASIEAQVHDGVGQQLAGMQWAQLANARVWLGRSDDDGELLVSGLWPTRITFAAEHPAYARSPAPTLLPVAGMQVTLVLHRPSAIRGIVSMDHRPVGKGMRVLLSSDFAPPHEMYDNPFVSPRLAVTGDDGSFAFADVVTGVYQLRPLLPKTRGGDDEQDPRRLRLQPTRIVLLERQEIYVPLEATRRFAAVPTLVGRISFDGVGVAGALVRVRRVIDAGVVASWDAADPQRRELLYARYAPERLGPDPWLQRSRTDGFGDYAFEDLDAGKWEIRVDVPCQERLQLLQQGVVEIQTPRRGDTTHFDVAAATGSVRLWIIRPDNQTAAGRMVTLQQAARPDQTTACYQLLTDERGCLDLAQLPAGRWRLRPASPGEHFVSDELLVTGRDHTEASFALVR